MLGLPPLELLLLLWRPTHPLWWCTITLLLRRATPLGSRSATAAAAVSSRLAGAVGERCRTGLGRRGGSRVHVEEVGGDHTAAYASGRLGHGRRVARGLLLLALRKGRLLLAR